MDDHQAPYANYFAYLSVIRDAAGRGIDRIDLGTSLYGSSQYTFKRKWRPAFFSIRQVGGGGPYKESKVLRMASRLWRHTPLWFANAAGPHLRKYLP